MERTAVLRPRKDCTDECEHVGVHDEGEGMETGRGLARWAVDSLQVFPSLFGFFLKIYALTHSSFPVHPLGMLHARNKLIVRRKLESTDRFRAVTNTDANHRITASGHIEFDVNTDRKSVV